MSDSLLYGDEIVSDTGSGWCRAFTAAYAVSGLGMALPVINTASLISTGEVSFLNGLLMVFGVGAPMNGILFLLLLLSILGMSMAAPTGSRF